MTTLKKLWPSILPVLTLIFTALVPTIQSAIASHPLVSTVLASVYAVLAHIMPSPNTK